MNQSLRGPKALTFSGVATLMLAVATAGVAVVMFLGLLPTGVLASDGTDGPDVVGSVGAPGTVEVVLDGGTAYAFYLVREAGLPDARLTDRPEVTAPDGEEVRVSSVPSVSGNIARGGVHASTVGGFRTESSGRYTLEVPEALLAGDGARVIVVADQDVLPFVGGIFGTVAAVFLAITLAAIGAGLTAGGVVWWVVRRGSAPGPGRSAPGSG